MSWETTLASIIFPQIGCFVCSLSLCLSVLHWKPRLCYAAPPFFSSSCCSEQDWIRKNLKAKGKYVSLCQPSLLFLPRLPELNVRQEDVKHFGQTSPALSLYSCRLSHPVCLCISSYVSNVTVISAVQLILSHACTFFPFQTHFEIQCTVDILYCLNLKQTRFSLLLLLLLSSAMLLKISRCCFAHTVECTTSCLSQALLFLDLPPMTFSLFFLSFPALSHLT